MVTLKRVDCQEDRLGIDLRERMKTRSGIRSKQILSMQVKTDAGKPAFGSASDGAGLR